MCHCPHLLLLTMLRRCCCSAQAMQQSINISCLLGLQQQTRSSSTECGGQMTGQTDRQTDGRTHARQLHRPCSAYYAGSGNKTTTTNVFTAIIQVNLS